MGFSGTKQLGMRLRRPGGCPPGPPPPPRRLTPEGETMADVPGTENSEVLSGTDEADTLSGLDGGEGRNVLGGGEGADTFAVTAGDGLDVITDFVRGEDVIDLSGYEGLTDFEQLGEFLDTDVSEGSTTIDLGAAASEGDEVGSDVLIVGGLTELAEDDFLFAA